MSITSATAPIPVLQQASIGTLISRAGVSLFPVYLAQLLLTDLVWLQQKYLARQSCLPLNGHI